jgi:hypothetical protein
MSTSSKITEKPVGELIPDARASLSHLLQFSGLRTEQWFMRISTGGHKQGWELLTNDSENNEALIRDTIARSDKPVTDLVFGFVGMVEWRRNESLMAAMQYFKPAYKSGLLFGHHLTESPARRLQIQGGFLVMGGCQNIWI